MYVFSILIITSVLSIQILERRIRMPYNIIKKTGEFTNILTNLGNVDKSIVEGALKRAQKLQEMKETINIKTTNSLGFSDTEWSEEKGLNTYRIVALGDSLTEGLYISNEYSWPKQLESMLNNLGLSIDFEVLNMGRGALGTSEEVEIFKNIGLKYMPDMIILQYYEWDWLCPDLKADVAELWEKYKRGEYALPAEIEAQINESDTGEKVAAGIIYDIAHNKYMNRIDREEEWNKCMKRPIDELVGITERENIKLIVITWDTKKMLFPEEKEKLVSLLSEHEIPFHDFSNHLDPEQVEDVIPLNPPYKCPSPIRLPDCHLTALGYEMIAKKTLDAIKEIMSKIASPIAKSDLELNCPCEEVGKESGCRVGFMSESENPAFNIELVPGHEQIFDGFGLCIPYTSVKINSHGFRDYEYPVEKPDNTFRIVVVGDSITFGQGVELNQTYSKVLEKSLNEMNDDKNYEVLNFGSPGYNIAEKVELLRIKAMKFSPDLVIFQYLGDDIVDWNEFREIEKERLQEFANKEGKPVKSLTRFEKLEVHGETYEEYIRILLNERLDEALRKVENSFKKLDSITQDDIGVLLVVSDVDLNQASTIEKISSLYNWPLMDLEFLRQYPENKIEIHPKDNHPTPFANTLIAENMYEELLSSGFLSIG